jgi:hypothetical protein
MLSNQKVIDYFENFPLYSSKYLAYKDWKYVVNKIKIRNGKVLSTTDISEVENIKSQFNSKRTVFDYSHLENMI